MSLDGASTDDTNNIRKFYNSAEGSDVELVIPDPKHSLRAHKVVLATGSECYCRELQLFENMCTAVVTLQLDDTISDEAAKIGIKHMYGIRIPFSGRKYPTNLDTTFCQLAQASVFAETYQIAGLAKSAFETANRLMAYCLEDERECEKMLFHWFYVHLHRIYDTEAFQQVALRPFPAKVFAENLTRLHKMSRIQKVLLNWPRLMLDILLYVVEKQSKAEKQSKTENKR